MRLSLQVQYAICGVFDLAYNADGAPIQIRAIAARQGIPVRYLEQIFLKLRRADLVVAKRGPGGGYSLLKPAAEVTLRDVVEAVEGPLECSLAEPPGGRRAGFQPSFVWPELAQRLSRSLADLSIEDLCRDAARAGVRRAAGDAHSYEI